MSVVDNPFEKMLDMILEEERAAAKQPIMVKSFGDLAAVVRRVDTVALHRRIIDGGRRFERRADEMLKAFGPKPSVTRRRPGNDREAKAIWLRGRLAELDRCIAAGTVTAEQAAIVENRIHHKARSMGLI